MRLLFAVFALILALVLPAASPARPCNKKFPCPRPTATPAPTVAPSGTFPKQGVSTGYTIIDRPAADRDYELDRIKQVCGGKPCFVRLDSTPTNQAALDGVVAAAQARGLTPFIVLYGTTGPRSVDEFGYDQAVKWAAKGVTTFEIANEPDMNGWTPDSYADFAQGTAAKIKSGNPQAVVVAGALFKATNTAQPNSTTTWCKALAQRSGYDYLSLHLYDDPAWERASWNEWDMAFPAINGVRSYYAGSTCRESLDAAGKSAVGIISSESGGSVYDVSEQNVADRLGRQWDQLNSGLLSSIIVYTMMDDATPGFGMLRPDRTERPAFWTFSSHVS